MKTFDHVIVGGGILGLSVAKALVERGFRNIAILEKESNHTEHTSGRNSGVVHQGIYYPPQSLKAKLCIEGARRLREFCEENSLRYEQIGKVILPLSENDNPQLDKLFERANQNGALVEMLDEKQLREVEPVSRSLTGRALFSPRTSVVRPKEIVESLASNLKQAGVQILTQSAVIGLDLSRQSLQTLQHEIGFGHVWNTAGLFADRLAHMMGVGLEFSILPFLGSYWELDPRCGFKPQRLIYPVPDLHMPFLGVHFTNSVDGPVYLGPNAAPRFGRENYLGLQGVEWSDLASIALHLSSMMLKNSNGIRGLALSEIKRMARAQIAFEAQKMVPQIRKEHILKSKKAGMRAQLYDRKRNELVMDFLVHSSSVATNVLNAVSPGFTCSLSFGSHVVEQTLNEAKEVSEWNSKAKSS
jgi:L-2-hydroxyglutarate oxidase LhgO